VTVELWIVRHGAAAQGGPAWPDDSKRPLITKGERQARRLATVLPKLDRLFTSPWIRAAQTAAALAHLAPAGAEPLVVLAEGEAAELPAALERALAGGSPPPDRPLRVACVGHEPQLSEAIGSLIAAGAAARPPTVRLRKGGVARLVGTLRHGGMRLELLTSQADLKRGD